MSYYDYDHFWAPQEVCGQKRQTDENQKLLVRLKKIFKQVRNEFFPDENLQPNSMNSSSYQNEIDDST